MLLGEGGDDSHYMQRSEGEGGSITGKKRGIDHGIVCRAQWVVKKRTRLATLPSYRRTRPSSMLAKTRQAAVGRITAPPSSHPFKGSAPNGLGIALGKNSEAGSGEGGESPTDVTRDHG